MINPLDAPEKRPSVMRAVELPRPAPIKAAVGPAINLNQNNWSKPIFRIHLTSIEESSEKCR